LARLGQDAIKKKKEDEKDEKDREVFIYLYITKTHFNDNSF
jgi:hypothetical protein